MSRVERDLEKAQQKSRKLGLHKIERHILLCCDLEERGCAGRKRMEQSWSFLKRRLKEMGLSGPGKVYRSKTHCLRICEGGPIAVVYPEGIWYGRCDPPVLERILKEHLEGGKPVKEFIVARRD